MKKLLLVLALPEENDGNLLSAHGHEILYTGVGKVNAALKLAEALATRNRDELLVVNLGSAGSHHLPAGQVVCAQQFFERDMDATALGFALGQTPYEEDIHLDYGMVVEGLPQAVCFSGDSFVTEKHPQLALEVIDMEAYALAKVCRHFSVPFCSLKFITDGADGAAATEWRDAVRMAAQHLSAALTVLEKQLAQD
ncbi:MAG: nucleosidase [Pedobacter sp.]|nr:nucleosidase [Pedobacter sp.]